MIAQLSSDCPCERMEVYLTDPDTTGTNIRMEPNGKIIATIKNDAMKELFNVFEVCKTENNWLYVKTVNYPQQIEGWIYYKLLSVHIRAYNEPVRVFNNNSLNGDFLIVKTVREATVKECRGLSSLIEYITDEGKEISGYISNYDVCGSPYTYCN